MDKRRIRASNFSITSKNYENIILTLFPEDHDEEAFLKKKKARASKFDLPIEFHKTKRLVQPILQRSFPKYRPPDRASLLHRAYLISRNSVTYGNFKHPFPPSLSEKPERSSRFEQLKPDILAKNIDQKFKYKFLRNLAIAIIEKQMLQKLEVVKTIYKCEDRDTSNNEEITVNSLPYNLFSWKWDEFYMRRELTNTIWVDLVAKNFGEECLNALKFHIDVDELLKLSQMIVKGFLSTIEDSDMKKDIYNFMNLTSKYSHAESAISAELERNTKALRDEINKSLALVFSRRDSKQRTVRHSLEQKLLNSDILNPIEVRYSLGHYKVQVAQAQEKANVVEAGIRQKIEKITKLRERDKVCFENALLKYDADIAMYRERLNEMNEKFERDVENIDYKINLKILNLEKLRNQKKFLIEQQERYREEIDMFFAEQEKKKLSIASQRSEKRKKGKKGKQSDKTNKGGSPKK